LLCLLSQSNFPETEQRPADSAFCSRQAYVKAVQHANGVSWKLLPSRAVFVYLVRTATFSYETEATGLQTETDH
jgi:hypothetical protein